jgi:polysaccharide transporter, PST family
MSIKQTFLLTTAHTAIKVLAGIVMNKVIAVYLGPSGLALIAQFQNILGIVTSLGNGSIQTGIIRATAESDCESIRSSVWSNALFLSICFSFITSIVVFTFSKYISEQAMLSGDFTFVIKILAISIIFYSLNLYVISILNGIGDIALYSGVNILISIFSLILVSVSTVYFHINGALYGLILTQSVVFVFTYLFVYTKYRNRFFILRLNLLDIKILKQFLKYGLSTFSSGLIFGVMLLMVRWVITNGGSLHQAGLWEAVFKIGVYFNLFILLPVSIYFLPKFSKNKEMKEVKCIFKTCFMFIAPIMALFVLGVFVLRDVVISVLFTDEFLVIRDLMLTLMLGEVFRISAGVFSIYLVANRMLYLNIKMELFWAFVFVISSFFMYSKYELIGVAYSYLVASFVFLLTHFGSFTKLYCERNISADVVE